MGKSTDDMNVRLTELGTGEQAVVQAFDGGEEFQRKLRSIGIREDKTVTVRAKHPFGGPLVLEIDHRQSTIGRLMAERILVKKTAQDSEDK